MGTVDTKVANPLVALAQAGQSAWLDYIRRDLMESGKLRDLIASDVLAGMTSNPAIFERAVATEPSYQSFLRELSARGLEAKSAYEQLAIRDIRDAADALRVVYDRTGGVDGYVSLEVSPTLAFDTAGTIAEARRLWREVDRANLMVKVPGTPAGIPAIRALIAEGINVNVTLLFAQSAYRDAADAYIAGLEDRTKQGLDIAKLASVASFFVSRIDVAIDAKLDAIAKQGGANAAHAKALLGKIAIANAKLAYRHYQSLIASDRWQALMRAGARPQRLLWASTSTKNPAFRDVIYVEELIGPATVNTLPPATLDAFRDHGKVRASLTEDLTGAEHALHALDTLEISLAAVTDQLLADGVKLFADAFVKLLAAVDAALTPAR
jgi:transaldolase/glucose-6-phosphate isomerase